MLRRNRQGWRLLIVLSRSAVAGLLSVTGQSLILEPGTVFAQLEPDRPIQPPPPPVLPRHRPPDPAETLPEPPPPPPPPVEATVALRPAPPPGRPTIGPLPFTPTLNGETDTTVLSLPTPPSLEQLTARRNSLNQILYRDRRHQLLMARGDSALSDGDPSAALSNFQALIDAAHDAFFWPENSVAPQGAQASVDERLRAMSPTQRSAYEKHHGDEARALLNESIATGNERLTLELIRRYPHTNAGCDAMIRQLMFAFDTGRLCRAAELADRLSDDPYHWHRLSPTHQSLVARVQRLTASEKQREFDALADGSPISPPALQPAWTLSFADGLSTTFTPDGSDELLIPLSVPINESIGEWLQERHERRSPIATANEAIVADDLVITRDFAGVRAINRQDGQTQWTFACQASLARNAAEKLIAEARGTGSPPLSFQMSFAGQGSRGRLTTDGRCVFFLDDGPPHNRNDNTATASDDAPPVTNRLVAVSIHSDEGIAKPRWTQGQRTARPSESLTDHFFLGPPLPVDGRLFVLTEQDGRIDCSALDASEGRVIWRQPIALTDQPIDWDTSRMRVACTPVYGDSVVICPTEVGVIVGLDPLTGMLRWVYDHIDDDQRQAAGRWSSRNGRNFGSAEFPSRTLLADGRVYHLPFRSQFVHCIDAATGTLRWTAERKEALALSAITDEALILIGPREAIALSPENGSLLWKTGCPEPAGHGLVAGDHYLLPTIDGHCLSIALTDGILAGSRFSKLLHELARPTSTRAPPANDIQLVSHEQSAEASLLNSPVARGGNLSAADDSIVITTPTHVAIIPQVQPLLDRMTNQTDRRPLSDEERLHAAMLHLLLDQRDDAKRHLDRLTAGRVPAETAARATHLLRELLFAELSASTNPQAVLDQLASLPGNETDRLRLLVSRLDAALKTNDTSRLLTTIDDLRSVSNHAMINPTGADGYVVSAVDYVADQLVEHRSTATPEMAAALNEYIQRAVENVSILNDIARRERLAHLFRNWPQVAGIQNDRADACITAGRLQEAELLLLRTCDSSNHSAAARAHQLLTNLYATQGLYHEAATHLLELAGPFRNVAARGATGQQFVEQFPHAHPAWRIVRRRRATPSPAYRVTITEHVCDDGCGLAIHCRSTNALEHHDRIRRKFLVGSDSSVTIIDRGIVTSDRGQSRLTLVNRETGQIHGELDVPSAYWQLAGGGDGCCGQLLPVCGRTAHGLSLLEKRSVWSTGGAGDDNAHTKVKVGPVGNDYCVLQTSHALSVIHPATGELKWSLDHLPPNIGLLANEATGIIGDSETLTLFDADQLAYTVYRMRSGRLVRRGQLPVDADQTRRYRRAIGARLVHLISDDAGDRLRIWDSASDQFVLDEPLHEGLFCAIGDGREYAYVGADRRLMIADAATGTVRFGLPLDDESLHEVSDLSVTTDPDHYYVNLVGCPADESTAAVAAIDEVEVPSIRVQGQLLAVTRTGQLLWSREVADAALLTQPDCRLPVMTLISRVRDPHQHQAQSLRIDVLDVRSGDLLARQNDLRRTRIVQASYRHRPAQLSLIGLDSQIDIDCGPSRDDLLIHAELSTSEPVLER